MVTAMDKTQAERAVLQSPCARTTARWRRFGVFVSRPCYRVKSECLSAASLLRAIWCCPNPNSAVTTMVALRRSSTDVLSELFSRYKQRLFASFRRRVADEPDPVAGSPARSIRSWAGAPRLLEPLYDFLMGWDLSDPDMPFFAALSRFQR
jgi:hypothetical protein